MTWEHLPVQERREVSAGTSQRSAGDSERQGALRLAEAQVGAEPWVGAGWGWRRGLGDPRVPLFLLVIQQGEVESVSLPCAPGPAQDMSSGLPMVRGKVINELS